jgi:hypothetical protein
MEFLRSLCTEPFPPIRLPAWEQSDRGVMHVVLTPQPLADKPENKVLDLVRDLLRLKTLQRLLRTR